MRPSDAPQAALAPGDLVEIVCTDLIAKTGQAVGRAAGEGAAAPSGIVVYVLGPVPGERARVRIASVKANYAVGELVELLSRSADRAEPFCPVFGECGGCQVQHLAYPAQLAWKRGIVENALRRLGGIDVRGPGDAAGLAIAPPVGMDAPRAYRNKMALVVTHGAPAIVPPQALPPDAGGRGAVPAGPSHAVVVEGAVRRDRATVAGRPLTPPRPLGVPPAAPAPAAAAAPPVFGFYAARTHDVVAIEACPIVMPQLDATIAALCAAGREPELAAALADAKHVTARAGRASGETIVAVTSDRASAPLARGAAALLRTLPGAIGISNSYEPASENAVLGRKNLAVAGRSEMSETIGGIRFRVSAASFFQVNAEMVGRIFARLGEELRGVDRIIDLYCGAGTFALAFARAGATVTGIEENPHAVREAKANAALNGLEARASFTNGRVDAVLRSKFGAAALAEADVVFLDPPRKGSDEATLAALAAARVPRVWYLSCNPATLARDCKQLVAAGYALDAVQPFDMFPQTGHIEALAFLRRADAPAAADSR